MATETVLTHPFLRPTGSSGTGEQRRRLFSNGVSTLLVAALHILFFLFFVFAVHPFDMRTRPIIESVLTLPAPGNNQPRRELTAPQITNAPPRVLSAPITVVKPPPIIIKPEEGNAPTAGDILGAVGRTLACSAGSWEHLTQAERKICGGQPWQAHKLPNGSLVMVPPSQLPRLKEAPPDSEFRVTGSEDIQRGLQSGVTPGQGGCPILQNTPCLHPSMPGGGGINVLGGGN
ncbi:MAG TPA: hypothetical protein VHC40_04825 [Rhizomicrobium sp.]|nr:hypothetical protein [Rhizomicrobium sp.]